MSTTTLVSIDNELSPVAFSKPNKKTKSSKRRKPSSKKADAMAPGDTAARVKRFHQKSRKGCLTCRQRRVKCDEQRSPNCLRCDKGKYICEWQDNQPARSRASEDRFGYSSSSRSTSLATVTSDDETPSHKFFSEGIVAGVASLFADMAESFVNDQSRSHNVSNEISTFYYTFVFDACQSSRLIRRTLSAICGLYERVLSRSRESSPRNHEYITLYSEAVTELRTTSRELSPDIVLIASILFANYEYLMGDLCSAIRHLRAGARILSEHRKSTEGTLSRDISAILGTIFEAFDHDQLDLESATPGSDYLDSISENQFPDLSQANTDLLHIYTHTFALRKVGQNHPQHVTPALHDFQRWSTSWRSRTTALEQSLDTDQLPWLQLLYGQHTALNNVIDDIAFTTNTNTHDNEFNELIDQVSEFIQTCSEHLDQQHLATRPFRENVGLILPLFIVSLRSTDAHVCENALSLLSRLKVVEGSLNSCCAYAIARAAVNARHAIRLANVSADMFDNVLPIAEIKKATFSQSKSEIDITIGFPHNAAESNAIVGGFCQDSDSSSSLEQTLEGGVFQGPVLTLMSHCTCDHST